MNVKEMLSENLGLKALSILLAVALWLSVTSAVEGEADVTVPVLIKNLSPRLSLASKTPTRLELRISGPKLLLMLLDRERLAATLDLQGVGAGTVAFTGLERTVPLRGGLRVTRVYPATIELKLAERQDIPSGQ